MNALPLRSLPPARCPSARTCSLLA